MAFSAREVNEFIVDRFAKHAAQCLETKTPPDDALFDRALDLVRSESDGTRRRLDRQEVAASLNVSAETVRRWEEASSRPRPLARLDFLRYALNKLESEGRISWQKSKQEQNTKKN